jgi:hypothetical protein
MTMRAKLAGFVALGAAAVLLAACGGSGSEPAAHNETTPHDSTAPTAEDAAKEAALAADAPPEAPLENTEEPTPGSGETPPAPEPTKSENIFY